MENTAVVSSHLISCVLGIHVCFVNDCMVHFIVMVLHFFLSMFNLWNVIFSIETWTEVVKMAVVPMLSVFFTVFFSFLFLFVFMYLVVEFFIVTEQKVIVTLPSFLSAESVSSLWSQCSISGVLDYSWYQSWLIKWYKPSTRLHVWAHTYKPSLKCTKIYSALGISVKLTTHTTQAHKFNLCLFINLLNGQPWQASCFIEKPPLSFTVFFLSFFFQTYRVLPRWFMTRKIWILRSDLDWLKHTMVFVF